MIEINLIPDVKQELLRAQRTRATVVSISITTGVIALGFVALMLIYVFVVQGGRNLILDNQIKDKYAELSKIEDLSKILTIQNQLQKINDLNNTKKIDSRVFDMLQAVVPPNLVRVSSFAMNSDTNAITIQGRADTYGSVEVFKKTLEGAVVTYTQDGEEKSDQLATKVSIGSISFAEDETGRRVVQFSLSFEYSKELFSAKHPSVVIRLTNTGNVTDSYLGVPRSVFVDGGSN
jgi:Tfp pilus assembly protein PilN